MWVGQVGVYGGGVSSCVETYNFLSDAVGLAPGAHDPGIVHGNASNDVDSLGLQLWQIINESRKVASAAARCEGTWNGEENDLLIGPFCGNSTLASHSRN